MNIYEQAIEKFGRDHQILKAVEELNELATALLHFRQGKVGVIDVVGEIADVEIMVEQLKLIFNKDLVNRCMTHKLERLNKTINETK